MIAIVLAVQVALPLALLLWFAPMPLGGGFGF